MDSVNAPSPLLLLAPELILAIGDELNLAAAKQLRLACKSLADVLGHTVLRSLTLSISRPTLDRDISTLEGLASSAKAHAACHATRELRIRSLSPTYDPAFQQPVWRHEDGKWVAVQPTYDPAAKVAAEKTMQRCLFDAIASLKELRRVEWTPFPQDSERTHRIVINALQSLPSLTQIWVSVPHLRVPMGLTLALSSMPHLREISTEGSAIEDVHESLALALAKNQSITSINVSDTWRYGRAQPRVARSFHQMFKYYPADAPPLRLRDLGLSMCLVKFDSDVLCHLKHLTSLRLTNIEDPYAIPPTPHLQGNPVNPVEDEDLYEVMQQRLRFGSANDEIWRALRAADIRLESIVVDRVPFTLLQYLQSYSGLKKLTLTPGGYDEGAMSMSDVVAAQFFGEPGVGEDEDPSPGPITGHVQTLEDLHISALNEGGWCFGVHNVKAIAKCRNLRKLRIAVISADLTRGPGFIQEPAQRSSDEDSIKLLLDTASANLPYLQSVHIDGTYPSPSSQMPEHSTRTGNPLRVHRNRVIKKMSKSIADYHASEQSKPPHSVVVGFDGHNVEYIPKIIEDESGSRSWKYVEVPTVL